MIPLLRPSPSMRMAQNLARAHTTAPHASGNSLQEENWSVGRSAEALKLSLSALLAGASPLAVERARFSSPRRAAPTALPTSICPRTSAALHLARMAGASPSPRDQQTGYPWCELPTSVAKFCVTANSTVLPAATRALSPTQVE